jgi:hypothetical protein
MKFSGAIRSAVIVFACKGIRVDPDRLPSIEVLLVPPKHPYPQVQEELTKLHFKREAEEKNLENSIMRSYNQQVKSLVSTIDKQLDPVMKPLIREWYTKMGMLPQIGTSLIEQEQLVENVAIHVSRVAEPSSRVRNTIQAIDRKRASDERTQVNQGIGEFRQIATAIQRAVSVSMSKYFARTASFKATSLLQSGPSRNQTMGINPVLNIRVGSSSIGDGLSDGASYPSIVGMVEEEREEGDMGEENLFSTIMRFSRLLLDTALTRLNKKIFPPEFRLPESYSLLQASPLLSKVSTATNKMPIPPGVAREVRKRAFEHSTVELNIVPPEMDDYAIIDQLNALLQADIRIRLSRVDAFIRARRRFVEQINVQIDEIVRRAAVLWGIYPDPENVPIFKQIV